MHLLVDGVLAAPNPGQLDEVLMISEDVRAWQPTRTLSITDRLGNSATFWKVRPMPISAILCGGRVRMLVPSIMMSPEKAGRAGQAVEQGGLAGAVRPDQAEDRTLVHVEGDAVQGDDAAEHDADVANREQGSIALRELCLRHLAPPALKAG